MHTEEIIDSQILPRLVRNLSQGRVEGICDKPQRLDRMLRILAKARQGIVLSEYSDDAEERIRVYLGRTNITLLVVLRGYPPKPVRVEFFGRRNTSPLCVLHRD